MVVPLFPSISLGLEDASRQSRSIIREKLYTETRRSESYSRWTLDSLKARSKNTIHFNIHVKDISTFPSYLRETISSRILYVLRWEHFLFI